MMEALDKLRLARTDGVGPLTYRRLLAQHGSAGAALDALPTLAKAGGRARPLEIAPRRAMEREVSRLHQLGGRMLFLGDADYPPLLALLVDAPPVISILGNAAALRGRAVGLVGARNASANGLRVAESLAADLASNGLTVVSGLARGVDAAAHRGALFTGITVAATAGGLDQPYPAENTRLQAQIAERGAVVTEAPMGTAPQSRHFPRRNRLIAGLCLGVIVVEAALRSGSLITACLAQDAHREVFAVPGSPLDPRCRGSNDLIRQGAYLTESAEDVLANLPDDLRQPALARMPLFAADPGEGFAEPTARWAEKAESDATLAKLAEMLSPSPTSIDDVIRLSGLSAGSVVAALVCMELAQRIEIHPGGRVSLIES